MVSGATSVSVTDVSVVVPSVDGEESSVESVVEGAIGRRAGVASGTYPGSVT